MQLRPDEISSIIKDRIKQFEHKIVMTDTGTVTQIGDGIAKIYGLEDCMSNELLQFENGGSSYGTQSGDG